MLTSTTPEISSFPQLQSPRVHLGWLDSLRALAALYVVMSHIISIAGTHTNNYHGLTLAVAGPFRYGHAAVGLFIVLSGFSLMIPVTRSGGILRGGAWRFFGRRAKRILPPYYSAMGVSLLLIYFVIGHKTGSLWDVTIPVRSFDIWTHLFLLQDIFDPPKINNTHWSIAVEWRIYFLFPLFILLFRKWAGWKVVLGVLAGAFAALSLFEHSRLSMLCGTMPQYFALFAMGMLACEIGMGQEKMLCALRNRVLWPLLWGLGWLIYSALLYKWRANISPTHLFFQDTANGFVSAILLIVLSKPGPNRLRNVLSWRPLVFVGTFAYSIYLIHMPIAQVIWQYGFHPLHKGFLPTYFLMVVVGLPLILAASYLFFLAFERPFLNTKKRETLAETARDAALSPAP